MTASKPLRRQYQSLRSVALGHLDWHLRRSFPTFGGPFNGQARRQQLVRELLQRLHPQLVVETGGFRGETTSFLRNATDCPVWTIEVGRRYASYLRAKYRFDTRVNVLEAASVVGIRTLLEMPSIQRSGCFFYLDAHSASESPVVDELKLIVDNWTRSIIMIDDIEVPSDPGYRFDNWHVTGPVTARRLVRAAPGWSIWWPSTPSFEETGHRRGCAVLIAPSTHIDPSELGLTAAP